MLLRNATGLNATLRLTGNNAILTGRTSFGYAPSAVAAGLSTLSPTFGIPATGRWPFGETYYPNPKDGAIYGVGRQTLYVITQVGSSNILLPGQISQVLHGISQLMQGFPTEPISTTYYSWLTE